MCIISDRIRFIHPHYSHKILYVGHDLSLLKFLQEILEDCHVVRCPDGSQAKSFIERINYSLLLLDEKLPDTTGLKMASFIRSLEHRKLMPIIILSENRCKRAGVIFNKPNDVKLLVRVIKDLLGM